MVLNYLLSNPSKFLETMENTEEKTVAENTGAADPNDDKLIGILSYLGILWIVAYILYGNKKTAFNLSHVKQGLGLLITYVALYVIYFILLKIAGILALLVSLLFIVLFILMIIGIINAVNGAQKPLPIIGGMIDNILKNFK